MSKRKKLRVKNPADMSLPPEERGRRRQQGPVGGTPLAQQAHGTNPRERAWQRDGERKLAAMMVLYGDNPGYHGEGELADFDPGTGRSSWDDWGSE